MRRVKKEAGLRHVLSRSHLQSIQTGSVWKYNELPCSLLPTCLSRKDSNPERFAVRRHCWQLSHDAASYLSYLFLKCVARYNHLLLNSPVWWSRQSIVCLHCSFMGFFLPCGVCFFTLEDFFVACWYFSWCLENPFLRGWLRHFLGRSMAAIRLSPCTDGSPLHA